MKAQRIISTIDSHTAGERTRMITGGVQNIPGSSMAEKKSYFIEHLDSVRKVLTLEPRGDAELIGAVLTTPVNEGSDLGVMFFDSLGFEGMCGPRHHRNCHHAYRDRADYAGSSLYRGKAGHGYRYCTGACQGRP